MRRDKQKELFVELINNLKDNISDLNYLKQFTDQEIIDEIEEKNENLLRDEFLNKDNGKIPSESEIEKIKSEFSKKIEKEFGYVYPPSQ